MAGPWPRHDTVDDHEVRDARSPDTDRLVFGEFLRDERNERLALGRA